jgi:PAS domain S-box-containing protein
MATLLDWPVVLSIVAGLGAVVLLVSIWPYREKPGARLFLASISGQVVWSLGYAGALLVFDPTLRWALAVLVWEAIIVTGITFFGFALAYSGRATLLRTWWFRLFAASAAGVGLLVLTNPFHQLVWRSFDIVPVLGLSTVAYEFGPVAYVGIGGGILGVLTGSLILFDTVVSYGRLYRTEAVAVGVSTIPPVGGLLAWLLQLGPVPQLNLTTVLFVPHVALDLYAFVGSDMFEFHPATRRAGERAAIDDLGSPVFIIDEEHRIVTLNPAAEADFGVEKADVLTREVGEVLVGDAVDPEIGEQEVTLWTDGRRRGFRITPAPLRDGQDTHVGYTLLCQDVTAERQRKQRLEVLNRILRHNLRNDINVVGGFVEAAADRSDDDEVASMLERASEKADSLTAVGQKARDIERALAAGGTHRSEVDVARLARQVATEAETTHPGATVGVDLPAELVLEASVDLLDAILAELVDNAIVHTADAHPRVEIGLAADRVDRATGTDGDGSGHRGPEGAGTIGIAVADNGPGIPDHELEVIEEGSETDLVHGSGLGLWLVHWGVRSLGGTVTFDVDDAGTTAILYLPT